MVVELKQLPSKLMKALAMSFSKPPGDPEIPPFDMRTLAEVLEHHEMYARDIAARNGLGALQSRSVEGRPRDPLRTAICTYRFTHAVITYDGIEYRIERNDP